jgi:hypothetical protein
MLSQLADGDLASIQTFDQGAGRRHLKQGAMIYLQVIGQGRAHEVLDGFACLPTAPPNSMIERARNPAIQS